MSDNKRISGGSVFSFLFMPQMQLSFRHFSTIVPVFMRTIAGIFAQVGLIRMNHPATMYGEEGVPRAGFGAVMGEAWHTLRTTRARPDQWCIFGSVILMLAMVAGGGVWAVTLAGGFGSSAQAQLFSLPTPTGMASVVGQQGAMFDKTGYGVGAAHTDYGIIILDKLLREGMRGIGGQLQNGMRALFFTFNSAVMIVAGIMLFWIVLSVIVDAAKTGTFEGGGRHNMVWAPIRIIFGLTLLIPLGGAGFNAGQFMVVKIAEWGSNLGTNMWVNYLKSVTTWTNVIPDATGKANNPTKLVEEYVDMWICRVAHNGLTWVATVNIPQQAIAAGQEVDFRTLGSAPIGTWKYAFTDETQGNLCGTISLPDDDITKVTKDDGDNGSNPDPAYAEAMSKPAEVPGNYVVPSPAEYSGAVYKGAMDDAYASAFFGGVGSTQAATHSQAATAGYNGATDDQSGWLGGPAKAFACAFVAQHILPPAAAAGGAAGPANSPLVDGWYNAERPDAQGNGVVTPVPICTAADVGACGASRTPQLAPGPVYPGVGCMEDMIKTFDDRVQTAADEATGTFRTALGASMIIDGQRHGWAGMGIWFLQLGQANATFVNGLTPSVTITPPATTTNTAPTESGLQTMSDLDRKMMVISQQYKGWWSYAVITMASSSVAISTVQPTGNNLVPNARRAQPTILTPRQGKALASDLIALAKGMMNPEHMGARDIVDKAGDAIKDHFLQPFALFIAEPDNPDTYPFSQLVVMGRVMLDTGLAILGFNIALPMIAGFSAGAAGANATASGAISALAIGLGNMSSLLVGALILSGGTLAFWLPMLPFVRVAFAVMGWMAAVFEAVALVPIAALSFLTTEGAGLAPGKARDAMVIWLSLLVRPGLTVIGYIGGIMVFNTFVGYFFDMYARDVSGALGHSGGFDSLANYAFSTVIFVVIMYTAANASFKMLDIIPQAFHTYMGGQFQNPFSGEHDAAAGVFRSQMMVNAIGQMTSAAKPSKAAFNAAYKFGSGGTGVSAP